LFDFNSKTDPKLVLSRGSAVYAGLKDNPAFTNPPPTVDLTALKSALDDLSAWIGNALDGGKKAIAERNHKQEVVVKMLRQLAHYVEANCKDDINIFLSSGFAPVTTVRQPTPPLSPAIRRIDATQISGQLLVSLVSVTAAFSYQLRWAPVPASGTPGPWTEQPVVKTRPPVLITGLTPGVVYAFEARTLTEAGYSDWSDSVSRMAT
jgi:hypothetical protein